MKTKKRIITAAMLTVITIVFIVLVCNVDVKPAGVYGTEIGLSGINTSVFEELGVNMALYDITGMIGIVSFAIAAVFVVLGAYQLISRRSLLKVDKAVLALGVLYVAVAAVYVFFEKVPVNFRPIIMPEASAPEASFPSSHTMITCTVCGSAVMLAGSYVKNKSVRIAVRILLIAMICAMIFGRLASGVHWFSDVVAGVLFSATLLAWYSVALEKCIKR